MSRLRSLAGDTVIYGLMTVVGRFITFMLNPVYTNYLSKSEIGQVNNVFVYFAFIVIFYSFGMESSFFRFYKKDDEANNKKVFTHSFLFMIFFGTISTISLFIMAPSLAPSYFKSGNPLTLFCLAALIPLTDIMMYIPYGILRMSRKAKMFAYTKFMIIVLTVSLNMLFILYFKTGISGVIWAQLIANIIGFIVLIPSIISHIKFEFDKKLLKEMLYFGLPTLPASLSQIVLQVSDRMIINKLCGDEALGEYSINYRLGIPMMLFVSLFDYAWKPFYLSHYEDTDAKQLFSRIFTYFTLVSALVFLGASLFMSDLVQMPFIGGKFINPKYWSGMYIIPIVLLAYYFNGAYNNIAAGIQIKKKTKYLPMAIFIAGVVNVITNFIFIPIYGFNVAAYTTLLGYFIAAVILYFFSQKVYPMQYEWKRLGIIVISTIAVYIPTTQLTSFNLSITNILIKIAALVLFALFMRLFGFFTSREIAQIKKLFRR